MNVFSRNILVSASTKTNCFKPLTIFAKLSVLDICQGSEYASGHCYPENSSNFLFSSLAKNRLKGEDLQSCHISIPAGIYLLKVNNRNTRTSCEWRRSGVFIVNFEQISNLVLVFYC